MNRINTLKKKPYIWLIVFLLFFTMVRAVSTDKLDFWEFFSGDENQELEIASLENNKLEDKNVIYVDNSISIITVTGLQNCDNNVNLTCSVLTVPFSDRVQFYADPELTIPLNESYTAHGSTRYGISVTGNSYSLQITNLDRNRTYYAARVKSDGSLETTPNNGQSLNVIRKNYYKDAIQSSITGCGSVNILDAIQPAGGERNEEDNFEVYKLPENTLLPSNEYNITTSGQFRVRARESILCGYVENTVTVTVIPLPDLRISETSIALPVNEVGQINATSITSGAVISYTNLSTNTTTTSNQVGPFVQPGVYLYEVKSTNAGCERKIQITINVYDPAVCPTPQTRVYANNAYARTPGLGFVTDASNAADGNTNTHATLTSAIGLLGLGSSYVDLHFPTNVPLGTPITVKLGTEYSLLNLLSGTSFYGMNITSSNNRSIASDIYSVDGTILGLLSGTNEYEITFVPRRNNANAQVNGVRIVLGGVLSLAGNIKVYDAYYMQNNPSPSCGNEIIDVLSGTKGYGVTLANGTVGVNNPRNFMDNDPNSYTRMYAGVNIAADAYLTPVYYSVSMPTDIIEIELANPNDVLNVSLLNGFFYRRFNGNTAVEEVKSIDINFLDLTLLSGNQNRALLRINDPLASTWDRIELRFGGVANVLGFLDIYKIERKPKVSLSQLDPLNYSVCRGTTLSLNQSYCTTYKWYETSTATTALSNSNSFTIPNDLAFGEHTYYIQAIRNNCEVMARQAVKIKVIDQPNSNSITIASPIVANCDNLAIIAPTNDDFSNEIYKFYTDQNKTQEITSSFTGHAGVTYTLDNNQLKIENLDVTRTYYVAIEIPGTNCTNANGNLKEVIVEAPPRPVVNVVTSLTNCGFVNLYDAITNFDQNLTYTFYNSSFELITSDLVQTISASGTYYVVATDTNFTCASVRKAINVNIIPGHNFTVSPINYAIAIGNTATITYTSDGTVTIYDSSNNPIQGNVVGPFNTPGQYIYYAKSSLGQCVQTQVVTINVIDPATCYPMYNRVYATQAYPRTVIGLLGNIDNASNIVDANTQNYATLFSVVNLLGLGSVYVDVTFPDNVPAGTPVTVKLGTGNTLLSLANGLSVQGINRNNNTSTLIGLPQMVSGRLLGLIGGENVYEFTFTPTANNVTSSYNGVRVALGGLVTVAETAKVYGVYYEKEETTPVTCPTQDLVDVLYGSLDLGLGVANALVYVSEAENLLDSNPDNYALMNNLVGVLTGTQITARFATISSPTDIVKIKIGTPGTLLNLSLLSGISVQKYLGSTPIGNPIPVDSNLISLELLSGNSTGNIILNSNDGPFDGVRLVRAGAVAALEQLRVYSFERSPKIDILTATENPNNLACNDQIFELSMPDPCSSYIWYDGPSSTANVVGNGQSFTVPTNLAPGTYTYYVQAVRKTCEVLTRTPFVFTVIPKPTASDVVIDTTLTADCDNQVTLSPTNPTYTNAIFKFYADVNGTDEILTGYSGHTGITYTVANNQLQVTGLTQTRTYYISIQIPGTNCTNAQDLKAVTVNPAERPLPATVTNLTNCGVVNLYDAITNLSSSYTYTFYNSAYEVISNDIATAISNSGIYYVAVTSSAITCQSILQSFEVTIIPGHDFIVDQINQTINLGESATINYTSAGNVTITNSNSIAVNGNIVGPFNTPGSYLFTIQSVLNDCIQTKLVTITVIDPASCPVYTTIFPSQAIERQGLNLLGGVSNEENIVGSNLQNYATLNSAVGLLGLGSTYVDIFFANDIPLGTPVTVKFGGGFSVLSLATGLSVQPITRINNQTITLGNANVVNGRLLGLLAGQNVYEYSYIPTDGNNTPVVSSGVRVRLGSLVTLLESVRVYSAYYKVEATQPYTCPTQDLEDVLYGTLDLGIGVANSLVNVTNANYLLDNNPNNYAVMNNLVGVLSASQITGKFSTVSTLNDVVKFKLESPGELLDLTLLSGISIQKYLGTTPVGNPLLVSSNLITLSLLSGSNIVDLSVQPNGVVFDGIRITSGGAVGLLEQLRVYSITRQPNVNLVGLDLNNLSVCKGQIIELENTDSCTTYSWYDGVGASANLLGTGTTFTIPTNLVAGQTYTFYLQAMRFGCNVMSRAPFTFTIKSSSPATALTVAATLDPVDRCSGDVTLNASSNTTLTNPIFEWFSFSNGVQTLVNGETTATLNLVGLTPGDYTYYVGVASDEYCMSLQADRARIDFTIPSLTDPDTISYTTTGSGCQSSEVSITASSTYTNSQYQWYFDPQGTLPIVTGTDNGITYTVNNNILIVTGLTQPTVTYYVTLASDETCANLSNLKAINLNFQSVLPPVLVTSGDQIFCENSNATLADIIFDQPTIIWYDALVGGNVLPSTTLVTNNGVYFAAVQNSSGCESTPRTEVIVKITPVGLPVNIDTDQDFCSSTTPLIANLDTSNQDVLWYANATGGTALAANTALINGSIYYAALVSPQGCEGLERLAVTVTVKDVSTPTSNFITQTFCEAANPTVADLDATGNGIVWYDAPNGNLLSSATPLVDGGIYYAYATASLQNGDSCISADYLAITVDFDVIAITGNQNQTFCASANPAVADLQLNQSNIIWFSSATGGSALDMNTSLIDGATYYADFDSTECSLSTRYEVVVAITTVPSPSVTNTNQSFCSANNPTISDLQVSGSNVVWFNSIGGNALANTDVLVNGQTYYGYSSVNSSNSIVCYSIDYVEVVVELNNGEITGETVQTFCEIDAPTIADLLVNESNVLWYSQAVGGTALADTTPLVMGTIYYADYDSSSACTLTNRFAVTVQFTQVGTPTVTNTTQRFCYSATPSVADLQAVQEDVVWYTSPTGGTPLDLSTLLTDGTTYYVALVSEGCEGITRIAVQVVLFDIPAPVNIPSSQTFCSAQYPTVYNLNSAGNNVIWKDAAGNELSIDLALANGSIYYAHAVSNTGCISTNGAEVTVTITQVQENIEESNLSFCQNENASIANLVQINTGNWYTDIAGNYQVSPTTALVNGTTYYSFSDETDRCNATIYKVNVRITPNNLNIVDISNPTVTCLDNTYTYTAPQGFTNYMWTLSGGTIISGGQPSDNSITVSWSNEGNFTVNLTVDSSACIASNTATLNVTVVDCDAPIVNDLAITKTVDNSQPAYDTNVTFTITVTNNSNTEFTNVKVDEPLNSGFRNPVYTPSQGTFTNGTWNIPSILPGQSVTLMVTVKVIEGGSYVNTVRILESNPADTNATNNTASAEVFPYVDDCLTVYNEISPNGDGRNDYLVISCLEDYPNTSIQIFNRYGALVYRNNNYANDFNGIANVSGTFDGKELPSGTYFYILEFANKAKPNKSGWLYIMR